MRLHLGKFIFICVCTIRLTACFVLQVYESVALVAVSRDWDLLRGYHVRELVERKEVEREGAEHTVAETTGGGGYP